VLACCIFCWIPQGGTRKLFSPEQHPLLLGLPRLHLSAQGLHQQSVGGLQLWTPAELKKSCMRIIITAQALFFWVRRKHMLSRVMSSILLLLQLGACKRRKDLRLVVFWLLHPCGDMSPSP